jgi:hypothetical protein
MSQSKKCELTRKRGAKTKTHMVLIMPDLLRDRVFLVSPTWDLPMPWITRISTIMTMLIPIYELSKESVFLKNNRRFGGGITLPQQPPTGFAPQVLRGFFYQQSRRLNPLQRPFLPLYHRNC